MPNRTAGPPPALLFYGAAVAAFVAPLAVYLLTLAPSLNFEDPMEFALGAATLGVDHPSGYPLETLVGHLFTYLPFGDVAWRLNVSSAFLAALAAAFIFLFTWEFVAPAARDYRLAAVAAWLAAGLYAFSRGFWPQAIITEVYALNAAALAATVWCALRCRTRGDVRWFYATAFVAALSAANHPLSLAATGPLLIYLWWTLRRAGAYALATRAALLLALGLSLYLYLALRASREPPLNWGAPADLPAFLDHVRRREFGTIYWPRYRYLGLRAAELGQLFLLHYGPGVGLLALPGLIWSLRRRPFAGMLGVMALITGPVTMLPLVGLLTPIQTFEINVWYLPFFLLCAPFAGAAAAWALSALRPGKVAAAAVAAFTLLPALPAWRHWERTSLRGFYFPAEHGRNRLRTFDYGGLLVFSFYGRQGIWVQSYYNFVEGRRRDVVVADPRAAVRSELTALRGGPVFIRDPDAAERWWLEFQRELLAARAARPTYYNSEEPAVRALGWRLEPYGHVYRVRTGEQDAPPPPWGRYEYAGLRAVGERLADADAPYDLTTYRLWAGYYISYADYCFLQGREKAALRYLATAERAAPRDARLPMFIASSYNHYGYPARAIPLFLKYIPALEQYRRDATMFKRDYAGFLNDLALSYLLTGDPESARRYYLESLEVNPEQAELAAHLSLEELSAASAELRREGRN
jgi:hypothetical protein